MYIHASHTMRIFAKHFMYTELIHPEDTIVATATAGGVSALAIIRVSGERAFDICEKVFKGKKVSAQKSHSIIYGHIIAEDEIVDEVMLSIFRAPRSFTAENSVEISCHGSQYIQRRIIQLLVKHGARLAAPGEFTLRAYLNGRLDLAQAEAVGDIIAARNRSQLDIAMKQMRGRLSGQLQELRVKLLDFISLLELELDFGEEDVEFADREALYNRVNEMIRAIAPVKDSFRYGNAIKNGIPVAIIGRPNAGKSSLLNALLNDERAIVSEIAGTTRDTIEEEIHIEGVAFRFIDTAGIRETEDRIEKIGIGKALKKIDEAGMVIYIFDYSELSLTDVISDLEMIRNRNPHAGILILANKEDRAENKSKNETEKALIQSGFNGIVFCSLKQSAETAAEQVRASLWETAQLNAAEASSAIISNERHYHCLITADEALHEVIKLMDNKSSSDLIALEMKRAVQSIGDITGLISNEEILGNIFGKFCIGK